MTVWETTIVLAAALAPASYLPTLRRVVTRRTADGIGIAQCVATAVSCGAWLGLSRHHPPGMYAMLVISTTLSWIVFVHVRRIIGAPRRVLVLAATGAVIAATGAVYSPWLTVLYLFPLDAGWYATAIRAAVRSRAAAALSTFGWSMPVVSNAAWLAESVRLEQYAVAIQTGMLLCGALTMCAVTAHKHRTAASVPTPSVTVASAPPPVDAPN